MKPIAPCTWCAMAAPMPAASPQRIFPAAMSGESGRVRRLQWRRRLQPLPLPPGRPAPRGFAARPGICRSGGRTAHAPARIARSKRAVSAWRPPFARHVQSRQARANLLHRDRLQLFSRGRRRIRHHRVVRRRDCARWSRGKSPRQIGDERLVPRRDEHDEPGDIFCPWHAPELRRDASPHRRVCPRRIDRGSRSQRLGTRPAPATRRGREASRQSSSR